MTNKDDDASKPPNTLTSRPMTEQREEARRQEKAQRVTNNDDVDALIPPTTMW
jgi:hypothetical protein